MSKHKMQRKNKEQWKKWLVWLPITMLAGLGVAGWLPETTIAANLTTDDLTSVSSSDVNFCTIFTTVRDLMIWALPFLTLLILVVSSVLWIVSGSREDFLTLVKNLVVKMVIGLGFILIFNMIINILGGVISDTSGINSGAAESILREGGNVTTDKIRSGCQIQIWHHVTSFSSFEAQTFFSTTPGNNLRGILMDLANTGTVIVGMGATLMILWGGIQYISAVGPEGATRARNTIMYASAGVIIVWLAKIIVQGFLTLF